ncbi:hypothetical protein CA850_29630 [Micromonospora echinospora]|nr:hypothetical protein CA850_29630 [Micromonospora echinospora]
MWDAPVEHIATAAEEVELIAAAGAGDEDALLRLFASYVPHLCQAVGAYTKVLPLDDARQAAFLGLVSAVRAFDPAQSDRLVSVIRQHAHAELSAAAQAAGTGFTVPSRTVERFFGILAKAGNDVAEAAKIAPAYEMTADTFYSVLGAVTAGASLETALEARGDAVFGNVVAPREIADAEDRVLVELAFRAVDDFERDVCRLAYGFSDFDPVPDAEIGHRLGKFSRLKIQRTRTRALGKMRSALGALNA